MLGILQAFCMAACLDREFVVDWPDPNIVTSTSRFRPPEVLLVALDDRSSPLLQRLDGVPEDATVVGIKTNLWMGPTVIQAYECWDDSFPLDDISVHQEILKGLFTMSSGVKRLAQLLKEAAGLESSKPYIGVHLRTGLLDVTENHFSRLKTNWTAFLECGFDHCCSSSLEQLPMYVASDDKQLKQQLLQNYEHTFRLHASDLNGTAMQHYAETVGRDEVTRPLAWAEWLILAESHCVLPTRHSKYSQSASMYAGCAIDMCNDITSGPFEASRATTDMVAWGT